MKPPGWWSENGWVFPALGCIVFMVWLAVELMRLP